MSRSMYGGIEWTVTPRGIVAPDASTGRPTLYRTAGVPRTLRLYWALWGQHMLAATEATGVPVSLLMMTVCTENGPAAVTDNRLVYRDVRLEPGYVSDAQTPHKISVGPTHVLISTAREALGDPRITRERLLDPAINVLAAARYIASQRAKTGYDPILVAAAYNAGGIYAAGPGTRWHNRWHLRTYGNHLDRAAAWYGDACAVIGDIGAWAAFDDVGLGRVGVTAASKAA